MESSIISLVFSLRVLTVPSRTHSPAMMLYLVPALKIPNVTTALSRGSTFRLTMDWAAITNWAPRTTASMPWSRITEEDFTEPLYRKAAQELFTQYGESGQVNPAKIISRFQEEEEQKEIAGLFNAKIHEVETKQDKEKALKETIERIKENSIDVRSRQSDPNDLTVVMQLINEQKELEKLKKTHISID